MKSTSNNSESLKIVIVDYGMGNLRSIQSKIKMFGFDSVVSKDAATILSADRLIFPGVGNFKKGMNNLNRDQLIDTLNHAVLEKKIPILGICLGFQLFFQHSQEGDVDGLGWVPGQVILFPKDRSAFPVPHVGWNNLSDKDQTSILFKDVNLNKDFYFTHSYYVKDCEEQSIVCRTEYGDNFISGIRKANIYGVQFHPEKSRINGLKIIENFIRHA